MRLSREMETAGLRLFGVAEQDGIPNEKLPTAARRLTFRNLIAYVADAPYSAGEPSEEELALHVEVIESVFAQRALLPAPPGVVFRSEETLRRWLELHAVPLGDALNFLEDRVEGRVHVVRSEQAAPGGDHAGVDLAEAAAEVMRELRRRAVATVPLEHEPSTGIVLCAAFLVERELWKEFAKAVADDAEERRAVKVELTGPWPPYDFVRLDFGG